MSKILIFLLDNLLLTGLIIYIVQYNLFNEFINSLQIICKGKKSIVKSCSRRIYCVIEQICRQYRYFSSQKRFEIINSFKEYLKDSTEMLEALANIEEICNDIVKIRPICVTPMWDSEVKIR